MVQGLEKLSRKLRSIPPAAKAAANVALHQGGAEVVGMQKRLAPIEDGVLRDSIEKIEIEPTKIIIVAGGKTTTKPVRSGQAATYDYALGQEFGTSKMDANPFFYPAWRALRSRVKGRVTRSIKKAIVDAATAGGTNP